MTFYTVAGAVVLIAAALECARRLCRRADEDIRGVCAYLALLRYVRTQVDCYALPIGEIFEKCSPELLVSCGWEDDYPPHTLCELFSHSKISDVEAKNIIFGFCSDFGRNYREEELKRCDASVTALEKCRERLAGEVPKKKKLNLTLCLSASAALIILLL